jgi:subtilisin-like proprotein convertase family protein
MYFFSTLSKNKLLLGIILFFLSIIPIQVIGQLTVTNGLTATQLAQLLAGPNITITNASLTGSVSASGSFNGVNSNIGMDSGVILSTGDIANAPGPNNSAGGGDNLNEPGTAQMDALAGATTHDAITLQFDFAIQSDFVQFEYIFASEEYPEYAPPNNSSYNDVFAFYISGPGIIGEENIALIPSTSNPVSINNINAITNNQYYIDNAGGATVQYDAWTTILTAKRINLTPCQTYTMKLVIADAGDEVWNSAVFLLENSFIQGTVNAQTQTINGDSIALEGCIPASFEFSLDIPSLTNTVINYQIGGTATNGVDYLLIDTSITIPAGQLSASIIINSIADGIPEGQESIFIIYKPDICSPLDTAYLYIDDAQPITFTLDETNLTCFENSTGEILVNATGGFPPYNYEVTDPQGGHSNYTANPITGLAAGTYSVQVYDIYGCKAEALVVGGVFDADTLFLPDGNGVTYTTQIPIAGFAPGETIDSLSQINTICATMEHSYLGDLELKIIAPTGQSVVLKQYPGGGSCDLGEPIATAAVDGAASSTLTDPGTGYQYCWNSTPTYVTMVGESNNFTRNYTDAQGHNYTDNYLPQGSYESFDPISNLLGATMNGNWTMEITDNLGLDNGYVFEWNISLVGGYPDTLVVIYEPDSIQINGFITQAQCGGNDGEINLVVNGDFGPFTFLWSNGATTEDLTGLSAGTYTVLVTDTNGCSDSATFNLNNISSLNITSSVTLVTCDGGNNGSIDVTSSGGTLPYTFSWDNGATTEDISNLTAGTYTLTITDDNGCQFSQGINVGTMPPIVISLDNKSNEFCGQVNGSISINVSGGSGSYGYSWDNGAGTEDITNLIGGTYVITVTDANGCQDTASFNIINDVSNCSAYCYLTIQSIVIDENCGDGTGAIDVTVIDATQPYVVSWNTGQSVEDISNLVAGTYTITVTDANQCVETTNIFVGNNTGNLDIPSAQTSNENCGNSDGAIDITVTGGTLPYTFSWDNGETTEDISNLVAGTYIVTITDGNGCSFNSSYSIINSTGNLAANSIIYNEICSNSAGAINLTVTGNAGTLSYLWSNGATTQDLSGLSAGLYSCTITDANGCILVTPSYNLINESSTLLLTNTSVTNEDCNNGLGAIDITIQGGLPPITYAWSNGATTEDISGLSAGTYNATITDNNGCEVQTGTINVFNAPGTLSLTTDFVTDEICGNNAGAIYVTTIGGTSPITYSWSNGSTSEDLTNISAGTYSLTATDANGCVYNLSESIINTSGTLQLDNAVVTDENCSNGNGSVDIFISGGNTPYTYSWSNGATSQDITSVSSGNYNVTITDANGCQVTGSYTVNNNTGNLAVTFQGTAENCSNGAGAIDLTITGGASPYTFLWNTGATSEDLTGINGGTYSCTITDNAGCIILTGNIVISNNPGNLVVTNVTTDESCGDASGTITLSSSGGTNPLTYSWTPNVSTTSVANGLSAGMYIFTITDFNGCTITDSAEIFNNTGTLSLDNISVNDELCGDGAGGIDLTVSGGTAPVTFLWNTGPTTEDISGLSAGNFSCTITDNNGCSINTGNISVANNASSLYIDNVQINNESCGNGLGAINITILGGTTPYTFLWSNGATSEDVTNLTAGNYTCDVTDATGCIVQVQATVLNTSGSLSTISNIVTDETCGSANGSINLNPQGGSTPYTFIWSNGATTEDISNLIAGLYTVTITDAGGCSHFESFTVSNNGANILITNSTITNEICGNNAGGVDITIQGGTSPFTFSWSNGNILEDLTNVAAGIYSVTITDFNGCSTNGTFTINENTGTLAIDSLVITDEICGDGAGAIDLTINTTPSNPCCSYILTMYDANNNGWGGNPIPEVQVYINGTPIGTYTVPVGQGNSIQTELIPVCNGETISVEYLPGGFNNNNSYDLKDASGNLLFADGPNPTGPGIAYTTTASCPVTAPALTYSWSNGATTEDLSNLNGGTYTVTVTDANGCTVDTTGVVQNITGGFATSLVSTTDENCGDTTGTVDISVTGGTTPYTFVWNNGATTEDIMNLSAGTYNVTVTDASGCSSNLSATVNNISGSLAITNAVTNNENCGDGSGYIDITVNGTATPFTYLWSNGATTQDLSGLSAGSYTVTITDNVGCMLVETYIIINNNGGLSTSIVMNDETCGNSDGNITVTANGGVSPYIFSWTGGTPVNCCTYTLNMMDQGNSWNGASIDVLVNGINIGNFTVFGGGANTETFTVCDGESIELVWNSGAFDNEVSFDLLDASSTIIFSQGASPTPGSLFTSTGSCPAGPNNPSSLVNLSAGTYVVTTTDDVGCSITDTIIINNLMPFSVSGTVTDDNCNTNSGVIDLSLVGGSTFTFVWSNGEITEDIFNLSAGTYIVTTTEAGGCSTIDTFVVNNTSNFSTTANITDDNCSSGTGAIDLILTGGSTPFTFVWSNGASTEDVSNLTSGTYTVTSTDSSGCSVIDTFIVNNTNTFTASAVVSNDSCSLGVGNVDVTLTGGTTPFTFVWNNGASTEDISNLSSGTYSVTITDASGCSDNVTYTVNNTSTFTASGAITADSCNLSNGAIDLLVTGGTTPYTFIWSNGATTEDITGLAAGLYNVVITDASGCSDLLSFNVNTTSSFIVSGIITDDNCSIGNGAIDLIVTSSNPCCTFTLDMQDSFGDGWDGASIDVNINGSLFGNFTVPAGSSALELIPICDGDLLELIYNAGNFENEHSYTLIDGSGTTIFTATAPPATGLAYSTNISCPSASPVVTYNWSNGATSEDIFNLAAGSYNVTVTETGGCTATDTFVVNNSSSFTSFGIASNDTCNSGVGAIDLNVAGGSAPITYSWSNGATTEDISNLTLGIYTVTITDAVGCSDVITYTVNNISTFSTSSIVTDDSCNLAIGAIDVTLTGGSTPYTYSWSNGASTEDISSLSSGTYTLTITDASGCSDVVTFVVNNNSNFSSSGLVSNASCSTCADGSIDITALGDAPYSYLWSNGSSLEDAAGLLPGGYYVIITGNSGCTDSLYFTVNYATSIDELSTNWFVNIYPNPTKDEFTLDYNFNTPSNVKFFVSNILGEIVHQDLITNKSGEVKVDVRKMNPGIYFLQLISKNKRETLKLVIAR